MKPIFEKVSLPQNYNYTVRTFQLPYFDMPWHYHPEYELTLILKGEGKRYIGDCIEDFTEGDLILIGPDLPHYWKCNQDYYQSDENIISSSIVVHLGNQFTENLFFQMEEMEHIESLFKKSLRGLSFNLKENNNVLINKLVQLAQKKGFEKHFLLFDILNDLALSEYSELSSPSFNNSLNSKDSSKINIVYSYVMEHFREDFKLKDVADLVNMSDAAFSRYFKQRTKKTFSKFIIELRIGYACKLLMNSELNIIQICFESGFNNLSFFNRQFKEIIKMQPLKYRKQHQNG